MKSYEEIANNVFKRRDKYIANKKRKKRIIVSIFVPTVCCIGLITGLGLWNSGFFNSIPVSDGYVSSPSENNLQNGENSSQNNNSVSQPSNNNSSQGGIVGEDVAPSNPSEDTSSNDSPTYPPVVETNYFIDSIDKINFYSAKKVIDENFIWPFSTNGNFAASTKTELLSNIYVTYPIDRNKVFTTTMVTYFTINLNNEKGFLAQKLGGTGVVEVVVTENNIKDVESIITFKRGNRYYSCIMNGESHDVNSDIVSRNFSSHKYIDGFNVVKNLEQENYKFIVHYDGAKVIGFECASFNGVTEKYEVDEISFVDDYCVVIYTKQTFTIEQLEAYFKKEAFGLDFKKNQSDYSKLMM